MEENENLDPVGETHDPVAKFKSLAVQFGLIRPGDPLDQKQIDFAYGVVGLCAGVADEYRNPSCPEDTVGDHIRAVLIEH